MIAKELPVRMTWSTSRDWAHRVELGFVVVDKCRACWALEFVLTFFIFGFGVIVRSAIDGVHMLFHCVIELHGLRGGSFVGKPFLFGSVIFECRRRGGRGFSLPFRDRYPVVGFSRVEPLFPFLRSSIGAVPAKVSLLVTASTTIIFYVVVQCLLLCTANRLSIHHHLRVGSFERVRKTGRSFVGRSPVITWGSGFTLALVVVVR